jgi:choline dehydrogenase-like flavoprotein
MAQTTKRDHTVIIIGTGFGGTMTGISLANAFKERNKGETVLMLERGTWWTTPVSTVQDKEVKTAEFLVKKGQPVQYWSALNHFRGLIDIFSRCFRRTKDENIFTRLFKSLRNEDGLFDLTILGKKGLFGLRPKSDGVTVIRASGVGGGSLVYSNITIQPPDFIFKDSRWPISWTDAEREDYFNFARHAIGFSVLSALKVRGPAHTPFKGTEAPNKDVAANAGLSNIATRSARLRTHWTVVPDPGNTSNPRGQKRLTINPPAPVPPAPPAPLDDRANDLWLDRGRVFQTAVKDLTTDYGLVDLAINDLTPEDTPLGLPGQNIPKNHPQEKESNYCERQSRCNIGCLPGARHTLNKQLMRAIFGRPKRYVAPDAPVGTGEPNDEPADFEHIMSIKALAEVDVIVPLPDGGYEVRYIQRNPERTWEYTNERVTADNVIVSAGCLGTNEIMLRCSANERGTLPNLSDRVGEGFSTNGDYLAFLNKTDKRASLIRGPVTTSYAHFNTVPGTGPDGPASVTPPDNALFHTLEDQGIPPAFATLFGEGLPLIQQLIGTGDAGPGFLLRTACKYLKKRLLKLLREVFRNNQERAEVFKSEEERISNFMCVVGMGRDSSDGKFRLGKRGDTPLRISKPGDKKFWDDPAYRAIEQSLVKLGKLFRQSEDNKFYNPFLTPAATAAGANSIALSHPLGGCRMAKSAADGVVDEFGRVFDKTKAGAQPFYNGLYIADASIIPTGLGVNPSLTISALSLRIVEQMIANLPPVGP